MECFLMSTVALTGLERVGASFSADTMLTVRDKTRAAIHEIAARCHPGMVEEDAVEIAKDILKAAGMRRGWHDVYVCFGSNTTKTFGAPSAPGIVLGADDIFLIDIGPVWEQWEGDGGDMARCAHNAKGLFHEVRAKWRDDKLTGEALYRFAERPRRIHNRCAPENGNQGGLRSTVGRWLISRAFRA
jgi:hypothetical protein